MPDRSQLDKSRRRKLWFDYFGRTKLTKYIMSPICNETILTKRFCDWTSLCVRRFSGTLAKVTQAYACG